MPIENSLEGSVNATLDALAMETEDVAIVGEVVHADQPLPDRPDRARADGDRGRRLAPAGQRPVRPLHPHAPAAARGCWPAARPPRRCGRWPTTTGRGRRWATGRRPSATAAWCCAPGSRTSPTTRPGSCGSGRAGAPPGGAGRDRAAASAARGRPRSCSGGSAPRRPGWLVACLSEFADRGVNLTRIESRPRKQGLGRYMFFLDLEGRDGEPHVADGARPASRARVEVLRVLGSFPAA